MDSLSFLPIPNVIVISGYEMLPKKDCIWMAIHLFLGILRGHELYFLYDL